MEGDAQIQRVSAQTKFKRFLLYASDSNIYLPGCRLQKKFYDTENIEKLRNLLNQLDKDNVFTMIKYISDQKSSPHPEVIPLVLSECCRKADWRKDALTLAMSIIRDPDQFLLFFKFGFEIKPKLGTGRAIKRFIRDWYDREESLDVASFIGEKPRYHGWAHADLIKLAHIKTKNTVKMAVYTYAICGKKKMIEKYGEDPEAKTIVNHFIKIDDFRRCETPTKVVTTIEEYILSIPYCNHVNLKHKKVWKALIPKMTVNEIVPRLHLISKYGLFRSPDLKSWDTQFNPVLFDRLVNKHNVKKSKIQPSPVCLELYRYQNEPSLKYSAALKNKTRMKKAPQIYSEYVTALEQVMEMAMENIQKTNLNYTLIIDNYKLRSRKCAYRRFFSPHVAAALLAVCLEKAGATVKIVSFDGKTNQTHNGSTFQTLTTVLGNDSSTKPFTRMMVNYISPSNKNNSETDVYVFLANTIKYAKFLDVMKQHRLKNPKNPRFIFCSLCGLKYTGEIEEVENAIVTSGFNDRLFQLINGFGKKIPILES